MRWAALLFGLCATGCPLPEDSFVLSGRVVSRTGAPLPDTEVTLSRNLRPSETRCDELVPLRSVRTDADGRYEFTLIRQEITAGVLARRFFSVEFADGDDRRLSKRFWFPDGDLELGDLGVFEPTLTLSESRVDGRLAWRRERGGAGFATEQPYSLGLVETRRDWVTVSLDSLGRTDTVPVESRTAWPATEQSPPSFTFLPQSRGARCPFLDVTPCPLTDGRYLPVELPADTPALVLDFGAPRPVTTVVFHGLVLARVAVKVRFDLSLFSGSMEWVPMEPFTLDGRLQQRSAEQCTEPGLFFRAETQGLAEAVMVRAVFEDGEGKVVPIVAVQEVVVP